MFLIGWLVAGYFILYFLIQFLLILFLLFDKKEKLPLPEKLPSVSVFIAARNEEANISECLLSLSKLDYPLDKLEILIGDDSSEDKTADLVREFIRDKPHFKLVSVKENLGNARGKANVLAHLARGAQGEFFFIADADIRVQSGWLKGLLGAWEEGIGVVSGVTSIKAKNWLSGFQTIDWIAAFGMIRVMNNKRIPVSAIGNNMLITREAYFATGGYEKLPFSITEDFVLFRETLRLGWKFKNLLQEEVLAFTEPMPNFQRLMRQRKRWMTGAIQLPFFLVFVLSMQSMFLPFFIVSIVYFPASAFLLGVKVVFDLVYIFLILRKIKQVNSLKYFFVYELISPFIGIMQVINFFLPGKVEWKGRKYRKNSESVLNS